MPAVREAVAEDAEAMSLILTAILLSWASDRPSSPDYIIANYVEHPDRIGCFVAVSQTGTVLGFQSLKAGSKGNPYEVPAGWGIIGTYVSPESARTGIGNALFSATLRAAKASGLSYIDATIGHENHDGLGYYDAMGFRTYKLIPGAVCKKLRVRSAPLT